MKKFLIGVFALGSMTTFAQSTNLAQQFKELKQKGKLDSISQTRTKARVIIGLANSISEVLVINEAESYLRLRNGNICNEFVYGKSASYNCVDLTGETYLSKLVHTSKH